MDFHRKNRFQLPGRGAGGNQASVIWSRSRGGTDILSPSSSPAISTIAPGDTGDKLGYIEAIVDFALEDTDIGDPEKM